MIPHLTFFIAVLLHPPRVCYALLALSMVRSGYETKGLSE
jgi:hypothetical protein